jgi:hypothetical protein
MHIKIAATAALLLSAGAASAANLVTNGSFETGDFTGWEQFGDTGFTFVTSEVSSGGPTDGDFHAAFGPTDPNGGGILQTIATVAGASYTLTFDLANIGNPPNAWGLVWDGDFIDIVFDLEPFDYQSLSYSLVASSGSTELAFAFYNEPSYFLLDNISLTADSGAIPEPASWALMIAGFGLVGSTLRRRRPQAAR